MGRKNIMREYLLTFNTLPPMLVVWQNGKDYNNLLRKAIDNNEPLTMKEVIKVAKKLGYVKKGEN